MGDNSENLDMREIFGDGGLGVSSDELAKKIRKKKQDEEREAKLKALIDAPQRKFIAD